MLPSLARLWLGAAPVAADTLGDGSGDGDESPGRDYLDSLDGDTLGLVLAAIMRGGPGDACETLFKLCATATGPCGENDPARREAFYRRACMDLFGVVGGAAADKDVATYFRTWKDAFTQLCSGFSPTADDIMYNVVRANWRHGMRLDMRLQAQLLPQQQQPPLEGPARTRQLDELLHDLLYNYGSVHPRYGQRTAAAHSHLLPAQPDRLRMWHKELLTWLLQRPSVNSRAMSVTAVTWLLVNRGARVVRTVGSTVVEAEGGLRFPVAAINGEQLIAGPVPGDYEASHYYHSLDLEIRWLIASDLGEYNTFERVTAAIGQLIAIGGLVDGELRYEDVEFDALRSNRSRSALNRLFAGTHPNLRMLAWIYTNVPHAQLRPAFGAVIHMAGRRSEFEGHEYQPTPQLWRDLVRSVYEGRDAAFRRSVQMREFFAGRLGDIASVATFLEDGGLGPVDAGTRYAQLEDMSSLPADADCADVGTLMHVMVE